MHAIYMAYSRIILFRLKITYLNFKEVARMLRHSSSSRPVAVIKNPFWNILASGFYMHSANL